MRHWLAAAILGVLAFGPPAQAQTNPAAQAPTKLRVVHTSSSLITPGFVADEQGFFAAHGLAVSFTPIPINSQLPAALVSGSAEIAYLTLSSLVQANDGGIELVAIAGTGAAYPGGTNEAMVARPGSDVAACERVLAALKTVLEPMRRAAQRMEAAAAAAAVGGS